MRKWCDEVGRQRRRSSHIRSNSARTRQGGHPGAEGDESDFAEQQQDAMEAKNDFWIICGSSILRHHVQKRQIMCLKKAHKYIDDVRRPNTTLDVSQESKIDNYWNVEGEKRPLLR